jgi:hypothetical protein
LARTSLRAFDVPIPNASRHSRSMTAILQHTKFNLLHLDLLLPYPMSIIYWLPYLTNVRQ